MRAFGMVFDIGVGPRYWYSKEDGVRRWVDNDEPVPEPESYRIEIPMKIDEP